MEQTLSEAIAGYIQQRKEAKLEPHLKALNKVLDSTEDPTECAAAKALYIEKTAPIEEKFEPVAWLTSAANRAKQICIATHSPKSTHSDAKASSVFVDAIMSDCANHVVTAAVSDLPIDCVGNAAAFDVARLLTLKSGGESLLCQLQRDSVEALKTFTEDSYLLTQWKEGFKLALTHDGVTGHSLNKQLYIFDGKSYHLLLPLFPSSLAHRLHELVNKTRFGDSKEVRDARRAGNYSSTVDESFPKTLIQSFGGSQPQNISMLNFDRRGQAFLLNCEPPTFKQMERPPVHRSSIFDSSFTYSVSKLLREFKSFLEGLKDTDRNFETRYKRDHEFIQPIIGALLDRAQMIQSLTEFAGWTNDDACRMKQAHGFWLDVHNPRESFQLERAKLDWLNVVASDFASWLSQQLKSDKYLLSDIEHTWFKKLCANALKAFERSTPKREEVGL